MSDDETPQDDFRSGYIAVLGGPNVGKSTFLNRVLGEKLSAVTPKPQTTRHRILGVKHRPGVQLVFLDTPGVHKARDVLNRQMVKTALATISEADLALLMVEAPRKPDPDHPAGPGEQERLLLRALARAQVPVVLALNKIDRVADKAALLPALESWGAEFPFQALHPISALNGEGVDALIDDLAQRLERGPQFFPEDMYTDVTIRFLVSEIVREKLMLRLRGEVPYGVAVTVETWDDPPPEDPEPVVHIGAVIHVEQQSQKGIVIGKRGAGLRAVGEKARAEIEELVGGQVYLELFVRVEKNWTRDPKALRRLGYR